MAKIERKHCTLELTLTERKGDWFYLILSLTYRNNGESLKFQIPWYGVTLEEPELIKFIQQATQYLESPAPRVFSKESRNHQFYFMPMECGFSMEFRSYTQVDSKKSTTFTFEMSLRDFGTSESVGCTLTLPTEEVMAFINEIEHEYENVR